MSGFDEREKGFEAKFRHDQETKFRIIARRNKLLGLWAAELMGLSGAAAEAYARDVVTADFESPGDDDVVRKVLTDLSGKGIAMDEPRLRKRMEKLLAEAQTQIMNEPRRD